jgi:hypothetical protein
MMVHSVLFYLLPFSLKPSIKSYIISTFHAFICAVSVLYFFSNYSVNLNLVNRVAGGGIYGTGDEIMIYSICYSFGYFLYAFLLMLFDRSVRTKTALAHHTIVILIFSLG